MTCQIGTTCRANGRLFWVINHAAGAWIIIVSRSSFAAAALPHTARAMQPKPLIRRKPCAWLLHSCSNLSANDVSVLPIYASWRQVHLRNSVIFPRRKICICAYEEAVPNFPSENASIRSKHCSTPPGRQRELSEQGVVFHVFICMLPSGDLSLANPPSQ
jgi:hypothetical protein